MRRCLVLLLTVAAGLSAMPDALGATPHRGLPADAPAALYRHEPRLPAAAGWPGPNTAFPRTSGTGRLAGGGLFWTDYLYDDHGATTSSTGGVSVTAGSPSFGTYTYPAGQAHGNGADIFRTAVLDRPDATYWRVDWTTLADPNVPVAEWTFDRDDNAATGGSSWPGGAAVTSAGFERALLVSSHGARLLDADGTVLRRLPVTVDRRARSFVVRVPKRALPVRARWRVRLASGLADRSGAGFAPAPDAQPDQTRVYNVTFRRRSQEAPSNNFWNDMAQTQALDAGDVSAFSAVVDWRRLARHAHTRQARPRGWSDRWYVSDVRLGPGIVTDPQTISDGRPNYLGRVQPYAVYVPRSYRPRHPAPLTFLLHSLTQNHNQYAATTPHFSRQACEQRRSICVTTLGRGPDGNYWDYAELDFWQVWHAVAAAYRLDPDRTVLSGYSMGGIGTNQLAMAHPDLFARAVTLAGAVGDVAALVNLRWVPTYLAGGTADELVPVTTQQDEAGALDALGYRYRWLVVSGMDHVAYELADSFADAAHYMAAASRVRAPHRIDFTWTPRNDQQAFSNRASSGGGISWTQLPKLGVGTTGAYWLRGLHARSHRHIAALTAVSGGRPAVRVGIRRSRHADPTMQPEPAVVTQLRWTHPRRTAHRTARIVLHLHNVGSLRLLLHAAGFGAGDHGRLVVRSDGRVRLHLAGRDVTVGAGRHVVRFRA